MSWGKGITLLMASFMAMIIALVYMSTRQDIGLVAGDYYETSLEYDAVQLSRSNYKALGRSAVVNTDRETGMLEVILPEPFNQEKLAGTVYLYCPSDRGSDQRIALAQPFLYDLNGLRKGLWKVKVDWESEGKGYMFEQAIIVN